MARLLGRDVLVRYMSALQKGKESIPIALTKPKKTSFMKNIFAGSLEDDFLHFTFSKKKDLPQPLNDICYALKGNNISSSPHDLLKMLAKHNFFELTTLSCLEKHKITCTELLYFYELLDLDPSSSALLEVHSSFILPVLSNFGSSQVKEKYSKRILNGEITGAFALTEESGGSDPSSIRIMAEESSNGIYSVTGEKLWVINASNADFFIVFVKVPIKNLKSIDGVQESDLAAFIIDRCNNIDFSKHNMIGLNECGIERVKLNNCSVSNDNLLGSPESGFEIAAEILKTPKFISMVCFLNKLKKLIGDVSEHVNSRKQFPRDLNKNEYVQKKLKDVISAAYTFESMLYFVSDIMDRYEIDISLESALLQIYAHDHVLKAIDKSLDLLGSKSYDKDFIYTKLWGDLKSLSRMTPPEIVRLYSALTGLEHAGNALKETVLKIRNPLNYPQFVFKKMINDRQFAKDKIKYTLKLYMNLHPSLKDSAEQLEYLVLRFHHVIESFLSRHGSEVIHRDIDLYRISEVALKIFSVSSVLRRASHSYCTGVQNSDEEILLARSISFECYLHAKQIMDNIIGAEAKINDSLSIDIAIKTLNKQSYFIEHPLEHDV